jgi:exonuclease VII large subunit
MTEIECPDLKKVEQRLKGVKGKAPAVMSNAINRAAQNVKSNMAKLSAQRYLIKQKDVKSTITQTKSTKSTLSAQVVSHTENKIDLYKFKANPKNPRPQNPPEFYKSQVLKASGLKELGGSNDRSKAFVAQMASGHIGIFERKLNAQRSSPRSGRKKDQPIVELMGLAVPSMIGQRDNVDKIKQEGEKMLQARLDHEINRMLGATVK